MSAVLISIRPKWVEFIASGKKTVEVRKTRPKIDTPFKCYIYCTKDPGNKGSATHFFESDEGTFWSAGKTFAAFLSGTVIGEFVCDGIADIHFEPFDDATHALDGFYQWWNTKEDWAKSLAADSCLKHKEFVAYLKDKGGYDWHISDLVIYDEPKELGEFGINRPPQSWCYVEEEA